MTTVKECDQSWKSVTLTKSPSAKPQAHNMSYDSIILNLDERGNSEVVSSQKTLALNKLECCGLSNGSARSPLCSCDRIAREMGESMSAPVLMVL